jgi:membrane protease YdiL (CAAX protease family)
MGQPAHQPSYDHSETYNKYGGYTMETRNNKRTVRNLIIFTILVLASGWLGRWVDAVTGSPPAQGVGMLIWIAAPLVISFLLRAVAGDGWQDLGIRPAFKRNWAWYAVSILVYPVCATLILVIGLLSGVISLSASASVGMFVQAVGLLIIPQILTNIPEEFGFRGYLTPKMVTLSPRHGPGLNILVAHILVGLIWGLWHVPYLAAITPYTTESPITLLLHFLPATMAASIVYGEIRVITNSVWPAVFMQTAGGVFIGALMSSDFIIISGGLWVFMPVIEGGLMIVLFTLIGVGIYGRRIKGAWQAKSGTGEALSA